MGRFLTSGCLLLLEVDELEERVRLEGGPAHEGAVHVGQRHEALHVVGLDAAAVEDAESVAHRGAVDVGDRGRLRTVVVAPDGDARAIEPLMSELRDARCYLGLGFEVANLYPWLGQAEFRELTAAAIIVLLVMVLLINAIAIILRNRYARKW